MRRLFLFLLVSSLLLAACQFGSTSSENDDQVGSQVKVEGGTYTNISVAELQTMMENKDFTFINVHIPFEGDIPATDLSIPFDEIDQHLDQLPPSKDAKIVLYCRSDRMSSIASEELVNLGYTNVWNLTGGMVAWERAGNPIER